MKSLFQILSIILVCSLLASCHRHQLRLELQDAEQLVWSVPDSAVVILDSLNSVGLSRHEQMFSQMVRQHVYVRQNQPTSPDTLLQQVIDYFAQEDDEANLAKAYYIQAMSYFLGARPIEAMVAAKEAENHIEALPDTSLYAALIMYSLGHIAESIDNISLASNGYMKALPYADKMSDKRRAYCFYLDAARLSPDQTDSLTLGLYEHAIQLGRELQDTFFIVDAQFQQKSWLGNRTGRTDSLELYRMARFLTDSCGMPLTATYVAEYLIDNGRPEEALPYLEAFGPVYSYNDPYVDHQGRFIRAKYLEAIGHHSEAFNMLMQVYIDRQTQLLVGARDQASEVYRLYDLECEKAANLQLQSDKRLLRITIALFVVITILLALFAFYTHKVHREREAALIRELEQRRLLLTEQIKQRLSLLRQNEAINWKVFLREFDEVHDGLLARLKSDNSGLTEKDLQLISLEYLHFDTADICLLLSISKQSIYNRRQLIRQHLVCPPDDVSLWIEQLK